MAGTNQTEASNGFDTNLLAVRAMLRFLSFFFFFTFHPKSMLFMASFSVPYLYP